MYVYICIYILVSSVTQSCLTLWPRGLQQARLPCPSLTPGAYSNSCPWCWWCHPTISSSSPPTFNLSPSTFNLIYMYIIKVYMLSYFSHVQLFVTLLTIACQPPLSMGLSRQEYWIELSCPPLTHTHTHIYININTKVEMTFCRRNMTFY